MTTNITQAYVCIFAKKLANLSQKSMNPQACGAQKAFLFHVIWSFQVI